MLVRACALARTLGPVHLAEFDALSPAASKIRSALSSLLSNSRGFAGQLPASDVCIVAMPQLSPTMTHGIVRMWAKGEGEPLEQYELLFDLDTDSLTEDAYKVGDFEGTTTMQIECIEEGFLAKILVPEGSDQVPVGTPIALMCEDEAEIKSVAEHKIGKDINQYAEGGNKPGYKFMTWQSYLRERKPDSKGGEGCIA